MEDCFQNSLKKPGYANYYISKELQNIIYFFKITNANTYFNTGNYGYDIQPIIFLPQLEQAATIKRQRGCNQGM